MAEAILKPVITLTTDFGHRDGFAAQMKGVMLTINPNAVIIDVTHEIEAYSALQGALALRGVASYFPPGTIHVAVVDPGVGGERRCIAAQCEGQVFIGPDNGLFSLVFPRSGGYEVRNIANPDYMLPRPHPTFHGRDIFAPCAAHMSLGRPFQDVGPIVCNPEMLELPLVCRFADRLEGQVIHVDRFGNLVSNIEAADLVRAVDRTLVGGVEIHGLSRFFSEAAVAQPLGLINSFGLLEIAVNRGHAGAALGVGVGDKVTVYWRDESSCDSASYR
jgi:hypothetical protein